MIPILGKDFQMPADGLYHLAPEGEFIHKKTGLRQILDRPACEAIAADFTARAAAPGFAGVLVDYDHESLDMDKRTEAAGWLQSAEYRPGSGLWGRIRWTDDGEAAVRGGRYRFLSPVWNQEECEDMGDMKVRPLKILNLGITNNPQLTGAAPLSNAILATPAAAALIANRALANALMPGNDRQRRAVFAKLRGAPLAAQPKTSEELDAEEQAAAKADVAERERRLQIARIIARREAIKADQARPKPWTDAAAAQKAAGVAVAKPAGKPAVAAKPPAQASGGGRSRPAAQPKALAQLPRAYVRPTADRMPGGRGLQWTRPAAQTAAGRSMPALKPGASIADWLAALRNRDPMTDQQRKAMFARMRPGGGRTSFGDFIKGVFQLGTGTFAASRPNLTAQQRAGLARLEGAVNATGGIGAGGLDDTAAAIQSARGLIGKVTPAARENFEALTSLQRSIDALKAKAVRTLGYVDEATSQQIRQLRAEGDRIRMLPGASRNAAQVYVGETVDQAQFRQAIRDLYGPTKPGTALQVYAGETIEQAKIRQAIQESVDAEAAGDLLRLNPTARADAIEETKLAAQRAAQIRADAGLPPPAPSLIARGLARLLLGNRAPMDDAQRRAMFAKMNDNYRGRTSPASPSRAGGAASPAVNGEAGSPIDHAPTRDSQARIEALYGERANLEAAAPRRPEPPASLDPVDPKAAQAEAMKAGKDAGAVLAAVQAAQQHNAAAQAQVNNIAAALKAKGVRPDRLQAEVQKELDRRAKDYQKALADFEKADAKHTAALQAIDKKIGEEQIRANEDDARAAQLAANDRTRAAVAADKANKAAELAAARKAEADKAKADAAAAKAAKPSTPTASDPIKENAAIKRRNRAYAEALLRGDADLAERLSPGADHAKNAATVRDLLPDPEDPASPRNSKALAGILSTLERTAPRDYSRL